jgi:hypothetical protein
MLLATSRPVVPDLTLRIAPSGNVREISGSAAIVLFSSHSLPTNAGKICEGLDGAERAGSQAGPLAIDAPQAFAS